MEHLVQVVEHLGDVVVDDAGAGLFERRRGLVTGEDAQADDPGVLGGLHIVKGVTHQCALGRRELSLADGGGDDVGSGLGLFCIVGGDQDIAGGFEIDPGIYLESRELFLLA